MRDLRVKLHAVESSGVIRHSGTGAVIRRGGNRKAGGYGLHHIRVAHPADAFGRDPVKQDAPGRLERYPAVLAGVFGGLNLAACHPGQKLVPVTDAEDRDLKRKDCRIKVRRGEIIDIVRSAGENDAFIGFALYLLYGDAAEGFHLGIHMLFADSPCDQKVILTAEVQHKNLFLHAPHSTVTGSAGFFVQAPRRAPVYPTIPDNKKRDNDVQGHKAR